MCVCVPEGIIFPYLSLQNCFILNFFSPFLTLSLSLSDFCSLIIPQKQFCGPFFRKKKIRAIISCVKKQERERYQTREGQFTYFQADHAYTQYIVIYVLLPHSLLNSSLGEKIKGIKFYPFNSPSLIKIIKFKLKKNRETNQNRVCKMSKVFWGCCCWIFFLNNKNYFLVSPPLPPQPPTTTTPNTSFFLSLSLSNSL